jgi:hypothetical protein
MVSGRWIAWAVVIGGLLGACGGDESGNDNEGNAGGGNSQAGNGSPGVVGTELDANILFSPMYSAYDGVHDFKLPAIVNGYTDVKWSADPADLVSLEMLGDNGVMITTQGAGEVRIIAKSGSLSGSAMLTITEASPADWELGEARYNNGVGLPPIDMATAAAMGVTIPDDLSCRNCHGGGAMALSVEHTPQQTGGYSDADLVNIFTMGAKPPTAGWSSGIPEFIYMRLHTWTATEEEKKGIIVYLRSFEPKSQGDIDFGGLFNRDGGT